MVTDERTSLYAALAFGGFLNAEETERVAVWAGEYIKGLEAERDRYRKAIHEAIAYLNHDEIDEALVWLEEVA